MSRTVQKRLTYLVYCIANSTDRMCDIKLSRLAKRYPATNHTIYIVSEFAEKIAERIKEKIPLADIERNKHELSVTIYECRLKNG